MTQSYVVTEDEYEPNPSTKTFEFLILLLNEAINGLSSYGMSLSVVEILKAINNFAANENNKKRLVEAGALQYYVQLSQPHRSEEEQKHIEHGLMIMLK